MPTTSLGLGDAFKSLVQVDALAPRYAAEREYREAMAAKALVEAEREQMAIQAMRDPRFAAYLEQAGIPGVAAGLVSDFSDLGRGYGPLADESYRRMMLQGRLDPARMGAAQAAMKGTAPVQESGGMFYSPYSMTGATPTPVGAANINQSNAAAGASGASAQNSLANARLHNQTFQQNQQLAPWQLMEQQAKAGGSVNELQRKAQLHPLQLQEAQGKAATAGTPMSAQEYLFYRGLPQGEQPSYKEFAVPQTNNFLQLLEPGGAPPADLNDPLGIRGKVR